MTPVFVFKFRSSPPPLFFFILTAPSHLSCEKYTDTGAFGQKATRHCCTIFTHSVLDTPNLRLKAAVDCVSSLAVVTHCTSELPHLTEALSSVTAAT